MSYTLYYNYKWISKERVNARMHTLNKCASIQITQTSIKQKTNLSMMRNNHNQNSNTNQLCLFVVPWWTSRFNNQKKEIEPTSYWLLYVFKHCEVMYINTVTTARLSDWLRSILWLKKKKHKNKMPLNLGRSPRSWVQWVMPNQHGCSEHQQQYFLPLN